MKKSTVFSGLLFVFVSLFILAMAPPKEEMLAISEELPNANVKMLNIDNQEISLKEVALENGLLVIFSCNTCPFVVGNGSKSEGWENRYPGLGELTKEMKIGMVLINSNEAKRGGDDSFKEMQAHYKEKNYNSYYVVDKNSVMADKFGALTTPHVYLFDSSLKLVYRGAIDDNVNSMEKVKETYLNDAIRNMVEGDKIHPQTTKQLGCSIKRV